MFYIHLAKAKIYPKILFTIWFQITVSQKRKLLGVRKVNAAEVVIFRRSPWSGMVMDEHWKSLAVSACPFYFPSHMQLIFLVAGPDDQQCQQACNQVLGYGLTKAIAVQRQQFPIGLLQSSPASVAHVCLAPCISKVLTCPSAAIPQVDWVVIVSLIPSDPSLPDFHFPTSSHICVRCDSCNKCLSSLILIMALFSCLSLD